MQQKVVILGSTGSIGTSTLSILSGKNIKVELLTTNKNVNKILKQAILHNVKNVIIEDKIKYLKYKKKFKKNNIKLHHGLRNIKKIINKRVSYCINSISGIDGLEPTIQFAKKSKKILLANKESIICGWHIISKIIKKNKTVVIPIDSEHFSIKQLTYNYKNADIKKIYLTASGGPFLKKPLRSFNKIKSKDACKHPNWRMGKKISIDSSNLMNKILELIEAYKLFLFDPKKYEILIHPQSLIHAIVTFKNGQSKFLYHDTDMRIPISNAIYDNQVDIKNIIKKNNNFLDKLKNIEFMKVDKKRFPIVTFINNKFLSKSAPIILNASNEVLVDSFIKNKIPYSGIFKILKRVFKDRDFSKYAVKKTPSIYEIYKIDKWARKKTLQLISRNYEKFI